MKNKITTQKIESSIRVIWQEVLQVELINENSDFFELGGHSLMAIKIASRINNEIGVKIPILTFFDYSDFSDFVDEVERLTLMTQV
ncbi:phosphopantetheine-binding protein [Bacillus mycoides]|uniref:phosphopantetheine-binding protein n=1 Tax=Bacillus mycoides TaxID=1405 RepID=UPI003CFE85F1